MLQCENILKCSSKLTDLLILFKDEKGMLYISLVALFGFVFSVKEILETTMKIVQFLFFSGEMCRFLFSRSVHYSNFCIVGLEILAWERKKRSSFRAKAFV